MACLVYSLEYFDEAILISTNNIHFHDQIRFFFSKISLNICFLELLEEFRMDSKNEFESATVDFPIGVRVIDALLCIK